MGGEAQALTQWRALTYLCAWQRSQLNALERTPIASFASTPTFRLSHAIEVVTLGNPKQFQYLAVRGAPSRPCICCPLGCMSIFRIRNACEQPHKSLTRKRDIRSQKRNETWQTGGVRSRWSASGQSYHPAFASARTKRSFAPSPMQFRDVRTMETPERFIARAK